MTAASWGYVMLASAPREHETPAPMRVPADIVELCRKGDRNALDQVFRAHAEVLERLLARLVGPRADVEDLLQETFAAAMVAFPQFRGEASVRTWLHRIAINVAKMQLRRRRDVPLEEGMEPAVEAPTDTLASQEVTDRLYVHLDALDADKRIAVILHVIEDRPIAEVAALTGASRAATKSRLFWARRALLKRLRRDPAFADRGSR